MNPFEFTISDVIAYKRCPQRAYYQMHQWGLGLEPVIPVTYFEYGTAIHEALEQFYLGNQKPWEIFDEKYEEFFNKSELTVKDGHDLWRAGYYGMKDYVIWVKQHAQETLNVVNTEERLTIRLNNLTPGIFFSFKYDLLIEDAGGLWIVDFKTTKQLPSSDEYLIYDDQAIAYQWAFEEATGKNLKGVIFIYLSKLPSATPELTQRGLSKRSNARMSYSYYLDELANSGEDTDKYEEYLNGLKEGLDGRFFVKHKSYASDDRKIQHRRQVLDFGNMFANNVAPIYSINREMECRTCQFFEPCTLRQLGKSDSAVLQFKYKNREARD
jgi:hypothetical protein